MNSHEMAQKMLELPVTDVYIYQMYDSQYMLANNVKYAPEQYHPTGELVKDEQGNEVWAIRIG